MVSRVARYGLRVTGKLQSRKHEKSKARKVLKYNKLIYPSGIRQFDNPTIPNPEF